MLQVELDDHPDYEYGKEPLSLNTRNGESSFEPQVVKKYQKDVSNIENQVISMYGKGKYTRDIWIRDVRSEWYQKSQIRFY